MRERAVMIGALLMLACATTAVAGEDCGCSSDGCESGCCGVDCCPCGQQLCTVMKTCKETVYEEQEQVFYRPVFKEEIEEKIVNTVEYVEETRYRCCPCTIWQPKEDCCCPTCDTGAACGGGCTCGPPPMEMVPVEIIKKVPYTVVVPKQVQKTEKVPRTVVAMEPYTVTVCIPHEICKQVPVQVCCPKSCCCGGECCGGKCCDGGCCQAECGEE
jgi:hypothetical protein